MSFSVRLLRPGLLRSMHKSQACNTPQCNIAQLCVSHVAAIDGIDGGYPAPPPPLDPLWMPSFPLCWHVLRAFGLLSRPRDISERLA